MCLKAIHYRDTLRDEDAHSSSAQPCPASVMPIRPPNLGKPFRPATTVGLGRDSNPHFLLARCSTYQTLGKPRLRILTVIDAPWTVSDLNR